MLQVCVCLCSGVRSPARAHLVLVNSPRVCESTHMQERCEGLAKELLAVDARLHACMDVAALRKAGVCLSVCALAVAAVGCVACHEPESDSIRVLT